jgi:hypothetical protein
MNQLVGKFPDPPIPDIDPEGYMYPPWEKYPNIPHGSIGWRMGVGEVYLENFVVWWSRQPRPIRLKVREKYPEPSSWLGYWKSLSSAGA